MKIPIIALCSILSGFWFLIIIGAVSLKLFPWPYLAIITAQILINAYVVISFRAIRPIKRKG